ncbi:MAG: hypothetical protein NZ920_06165 [Aigarchaeota archaeon]|nr:hypothetical protein [Aigarchaeota archaeon]MDW8092691.1 thiamine-phosphate synthase family protein [Nitrososphaerota archaeon]
MLPPEEIYVREFLPALRGLLAHRMRELGYTQGKIATALKVTQAAVSQYLSEGKERYEARIASLGIPKREVEALLGSVVGNPLDHKASTEALIHGWRDFLGKGYLCEYHRSRYPELVGCDVCIITYNKSFNEGDRSILENLEWCVKAIEERPYMSLLSPEVGMNIAECLHGAGSPHQVAAIPGRIVRVGGGLKAVSRPAFGSSQHLAAILTSLNRVHQKVRSVMNIRFDQYVEHAVRRLGLKYVYTGDPKDLVDENQIIRRVSHSVLTDPSIDVVFDRGGQGFEPATYVFGVDSVSAVKKAVDLAREVLSLKT